MMDRLHSIWFKLHDAVDGLKTLSVAAVFFLLGVADYMDVVNVRPALDYIIGEDKASKIMVFLPIIFATLRFVTKDRPRWMQRQRQWQQQGDVRAVDECNQLTEH